MNLQPNEQVIIARNRKMTDFIEGPDTQTMPDVELEDGENIFIQIEIKAPPPKPPVKN